MLEGHIFLTIHCNKLQFQLCRVTTKLDQMKMFGSTSEQSKYLPLMITSQHGKGGT